MGKNTQNGSSVPDVLNFKPKQNKPGVSRDEARSQEKRRRNRMRKLARIGIYAFLILVVAALGLVFAFSVFFKTDTITINGATVYPPDIIIEKSGVSEGGSLFGVSAERIAANLEKELPYVGEVSIERKLPSTLIINITETKEAAAISFEGAYVLLNSEGKILSTDAILTRDDIPVVKGVTVVNPVKGGKAEFETETVTSAPESETEEGKTDDETQEEAVIIDRGAVLLKILKAADGVKLEKLTDIDLTDISNITMQYDGRITVKLGTDTNIETKIKRAKAALDNVDETNKYSVGVLDLTVEPYTYFRSGKDTPKKAKGKAADTSKKQTKKKN